MKLYVLEGALDEMIHLGCSLSKEIALESAKATNESGGIGYCGNEVWVKEYEITDDAVTPFDDYE